MSFYGYPKKNEEAQASEDAEEPLESLIKKIWKMDIQDVLSLEENLQLMKPCSSPISQDDPTDFDLAVPLNSRTADDIIKTEFIEFSNASNNHNNCEDKHDRNAFRKNKLHVNEISSEDTFFNAIDFENNNRRLTNDLFLKSLYDTKTNLFLQQANHLRNLSVWRSQDNNVSPDNSPKAEIDVFPKDEYNNNYGNGYKNSENLLQQIENPGHSTAAFQVSSSRENSTDFLLQSRCSYDSRNKENHGSSALHKNWSLNALNNHNSTALNEFEDNGRTVNGDNFSPKFRCSGNSCANTNSFLQHADFRNLSVWRSKDNNVSPDNSPKAEIDVFPEDEYNNNYGHGYKNSENLLQQIENPGHSTAAFQVSSSRENSTDFLLQPCCSYDSRNKENHGASALYKNWSLNALNNHNSTALNEFEDNGRTVNGDNFSPKFRCSGNSCDKYNGNASLPYKYWNVNKSTNRNLSASNEFENNGRMVKKHGNEHLHNRYWSSAENLNPISSENIKYNDGEINAGTIAINDYQLLSNGNGPVDPNRIDIGSAAPRSRRNITNFTEDNHNGVSTNKFKNARRFCKFCFKNKFSPRTYYSHKLRNKAGKITCRYLRNLTCPICMASGDNAHTKKYCPKYKYDDVIQFLNLL